MTNLETVRTGRVHGLRNLVLGESSWLCVLVKEAHMILGRAKPEAPRALELVGERHYKADRLIEESDLAAAARETCDVVLTGSAYAAGLATFTDTSLSVGALRRNVRVHGARVIEAHRGQLTYTAAQPFERAALSKANAYGGSMPRARRRRGAFGANARAGVEQAAPFYPRNASGRGFCLSDNADLLAGSFAPSQEDPEDPVSPARLAVNDVQSWVDAPLAADYGPVDLFEFPRAQFLRPYKLSAAARSLEGRRGWFQPPAHDLRVEVDPRVASAAAPGLSGIVSAGDRCLTQNLFPGGGEASFRVPSGPRAVDVALPGAGRYGAPLELRTLHLRPDEGLLELTWVGRIPVFFEYPEAMLPSLVVDVGD